MITCLICRFDIELDDVALGSARGRCVCLRCYARETADPRPMPRALRRSLTAVLDDVAACDEEAPSAYHGRPTGENGTAGAT